MAVCAIAATVCHLVPLAWLSRVSTMAPAPRSIASPVRARLLPPGWPGRVKPNVDAQPAPAPPSEVGGTTPAPSGSPGKGDGSDLAALDFGSYLPRSVLSVGPQPAGAVDIPYPRFAGDNGRYRAEVVLYVDETGWVRRVDIAPDALPPPLAAAVRQTFLSAVFRPGEVNGVAVRSRVRLEVRFDAGQGGSR